MIRWGPWDVLVCTPVFLGYRVTLFSYPCISYLCRSLWMLLNDLVWISCKGKWSCTCGFLMFFFLCNFSFPLPCTQSDVCRFSGVSRFPALQRSEHTSSYSASQLRWWIVKINDLIWALCLDQSSAHRKYSSVSHCYYLLDAHYLQRGFMCFLGRSLLKAYNVVGETGHIHSS